jgi:hypothetical protein
MTIVYCTNDDLKVLAVETVRPHNFPFGAILDLPFFHKGAMCLRGAFLSSVTYEEVLLRKYCGTAPLFLFKIYCIGTTKVHSMQTTEHRM